MSVSMYQHSQGVSEQIGTADTLAEALAWLREAWNEEPTGPQLFTVEDGQGNHLALLLRDRSCPTLCHTLYPDGSMEHHRCVYELDGAGSYAGTLVVPVTPV